MRFLADMGISPQTVKWLRQQGYDSVHLAEEGLQQLADADILSKARTEQRIVLTVDLDFGYLLAVSQANLPSVVIFRLGNASRKELEARLAAVLANCADDLCSGAVVSVNDDVFRVRILPI